MLNRRTEWRGRIEKTSRKKGDKKRFPYPEFATSQEKKLADTLKGVKGESERR